MERHRSWPHFHSGVIRLTAALCADGAFCAALLPEASLFLLAAVAPVRPLPHPSDFPPPKPELWVGLVQQGTVFSLFWGAMEAILRPDPSTLRPSRDPQDTPVESLRAVGTVLRHTAQEIPAGAFAQPPVVRRLEVWPTVLAPVKLDRGLNQRFPLPPRRRLSKEPKARLSQGSCAHPPTSQLYSISSQKEYISAPSACLLAAGASL